MSVQAAAGCLRGRIRLRRRPATAALVLGLLVLAGCSPPAPPPEGDPLTEYRLYLEALVAGDEEAALARSWRPRRERDRRDVEARLAETSRLLSEKSLRIEALEARREGNWALVVLRITQRAGAGELIALREEMLLGVEGSWRVVARSHLDDESLRGRRDASFDALREWFRASDEELAARWLRGGGSAQAP